MSMIAAMREAALLCGYYPTAEYRRDKLRPNGRLRKSVQELSSEDLLEMSDAELLDLADGDLEDEPVAEHDG